MSPARPRWCAGIEAAIARAEAELATLRAQGGQDEPDHYDPRRAAGAAREHRLVRHIDNLRALLPAQREERG